MLFANGYRYHMRNIGCPMSLDGYGLSSGYFGRYRHSIGTINNYDSYLHASTRRSITPNCRRSRARIRRQTNGRIETHHNSVSNIFEILRSVFCVNHNRRENDNADSSNAYLLSGILPLVSRKCIISMTSALFLLLFLGVVFTIVGGINFQRGNHPSSFKDNIHQLLSIIAIIVGIIMLLSSAVLFRVLFCKSKWNNSYSSRHRVIVSSTNSNHMSNGTSSNCNETVLHMRNNAELYPNWQFTVPFSESGLNDEPPTYSECNVSVQDLPGHIESLSNTNTNSNTSSSTPPPPKYTNEPPPRYSQLDVRTLMVAIVPSESTQEDNASFRDYSQESPLPAIESISSPNNSLNEIESESILVIEDYRLC